MSKGDKSLWDLAVDASNTPGSAGYSPGDEASLLVVGSKNSGKTSLIMRFLDRDELPKPTVALEYTFARRAKGHNIAKEVGHIWELGGGTWLTQLIDIPITPETVKSTSVVIFVDLSCPNELWFTLESLIDSLKKAVNAAINEAWKNDSNIKDTLKEKSLQRFGEEHPDLGDLVELFPVPLVIVGGKYDLFQELESEKRKIICKTLRFVAHRYGAHLQFFSSKQQDLLMRSKAMVSHLLFSTAGSKSTQFDHNKALLIPFGSDSMQQIGVPPLADGDVGRVTARNPLELWKLAYTNHFEQKSASDPASVEDPAKDAQYREPAVDDMRQQKDEELERYRRISERKAKEAQRALTEAMEQ